MISLRIQTLAAAATAAMSLFGGVAHAGAPLCADASACAGSYRPASPAYAFVPPGPAYTDAGSAYEGREHGRRAAAERAYGGDRRTWGPAATLPPPPYAADEADEARFQGRAGRGYAPMRGGYAQGGYTARYAEGYASGPALPPGPGFGPGPGYGPGFPQARPLPADCAETCVPAYAFVPYVPAREVISLPGEVYSGGVGVTEFSGGGGGGFNGNFEVQGFGDVSAFTSAHAQAQANAVANAQSLAIAKANASAQANANVNIKIKAGFFGQQKPMGCNTCGPVKPQPKPDCGCGVGGGKMGGWGGAPMARGGMIGGKRH